ncbi:MFS transporter [Actinocatenispora comari]|uniref:MFS transporter n=1 Tax=Actinocatenispora comari TaxID=2807577 RepID=A0A8J4A8W3_9ACTN|nr:MFS transporter [Actinocatenispora comari]GIL25460.1 MFS transporter [Actinocatenispora comari]
MSTPNRTAARPVAMQFVLLIGVVSLFSDLTHEGARSISGPYLATLGASALVVAGVAGFGELLGYALRFVFGWAADRTGRYWPITLIGYLVQMAAVPLLALAGSWPTAAALIATERTGRAIRNPPRDAMLAHAATTVGRGWVFGVREALDAVGGMLGPLAVALVLWLHGGYRLSFALLAIPALLCIAVLARAWRRYPQPAELENAPAPTARTRIPPAFWCFLLAMGLVGLGYADYPLIAFRLDTDHVVGPDLIPVLYAAAMAAEALAALALGRLFDRYGMPTLVGATLLTAAFGPLVFLGTAPLVVLGVICWGIGMAAQESIVKAVVTGLVDPRRRAFAFGLFDTGFGVFWFAGSLLLGLLYDTSVTGLVTLTIVAQLAAIPMFLLTSRLRRTAV